MKKLVLKRLTALIIIQLVLVLSIKAQDTEFIKNYSKDYGVNVDTKLEIINKYGNVDIRDWNKNSVSIEVEVKANTSNKNKAEKILENIDIEFSEIGNSISVETTFGESFKKVFGFWNGDSKKFEINYVVNMPASIPLNLQNKYGSVFISELTSTSNIEVRYGNLKANRIIHGEEKPLTQIILAYSDGTIEECKWSKFDIKYSKININKSKALVIISKNSKVFIDDGTSVVSESKYDNYEIGKIMNFLTTSGYSNFKFNEISKKIQVESKYSDFKVDYMPAGFDKIRIDNKYGKYKIGIDSKASYNIDGYARYSKIIYPENANVSLIEKSNEMTVKGLIGSDQNTNSTVNINTSYGNVRLSE
jgi:hypothetical protein